MSVSSNASYRRVLDRALGKIGDYEAEFSCPRPRQRIPIIDPNLRLRPYALGRLTENCLLVLVPKGVAADHPEGDLADPFLMNLSLANVDHVLEDVIHPAYERAVPKNNVVLEPPVDSFDEATSTSALAGGSIRKKRNVLRVVAHERRRWVREVRSDDPMQAIVTRGNKLDRCEILVDVQAVELALRNIRNTFGKTVVLDWAHSQGAFDDHRLLRKKILGPRRDPADVVAEVVTCVDEVISEQRQQRGVAVQPRRAAVPELAYVRQQILRAHVIAAEKHLASG